jgi:hypothetical protein
MVKIRPVKTALIFAILLGGWHLAWSLLVATGWAQPLIDFIFWIHFIQPVYAIQKFNIGIALLFGWHHRGNRLCNRLDFRGSLEQVAHVVLNCRRRIRHDLDSLDIPMPAFAANWVSPGRPTAAPRDARR